MHALVALISVLLSLYVATRLLDLQLSEVLSALFPAFLAVSVMAVAVHTTLLITVNLAPVAQLILGILVGGGSYVSTLWLFKPQVVLDASQKLRMALGRR